MKPRHRSAATHGGVKNRKSAKITASFEEALSLHQRGQLAQAHWLYQQVLLMQPDYPDAQHLLGVIALQSRDPQKAVALIDKAIALNPKDARYHFNRGLALHELGLWSEALASYDRALEVLPDDPAVHNSRGNALKELHRWDEALEGYDRAVGAKPDYAGAFYNRGVLLHELRRWDAALDSFDRALAIRADDVAAHNNRGVTLHELKRWEEALDSYDRALRLRSDDAAIFKNRGNTLRVLKRWDEALESYDRALTNKPEDAVAFNSRGITLQELQRWDEALQSYERAITLKPDYVEVYSNRGLALQGLRRLDEALQSYDRAVMLKPDYAEAYNNRGIALQELKRLDAALDSYDRAIALKPDYFEAFSNRGNVLGELKRYREALDSYDRALDINPDFAEAYSNRGNVLGELSRWNEALDSHERAIVCRPGYAEGHHNFSLCLLVTGNYVRGWEEYEWRWQCAQLAKGKRKFSQPLWLGKESLEGRSVLLHSEQGLGDTLQFCRYVKQVNERGARVILEVERPLLRVLATLDGVSQLVEKGTTLPPFDYHCPLLSLPLAFRTELRSIPIQEAYLGADPEKVNSWKERLGTTRKVRVGLVWSGGFRPDQPELWGVNERRNIRLAKLASLRNEHIEFYSLQKGQPAESELGELIASGWEGPAIIDYTSELADFSDTAALIENLDLMISVDTSTAHLAGSLGKPVWLLNRFDTCWRWLLDREDSVWYPSFRLFRQQKAGDWDGVIDRVQQALLLHARDSAADV